MKLVFDVSERGYRMKAWYQGKQPNALVKVYKGRKLFWRGFYPAYRIWNLAAHFGDMIDVTEAERLEEQEG